MASWKRSACLPKRAVKRRTVLRLTPQRRAVARQPVPSARCSAMTTRVPSAVRRPNRGCWRVRRSCRHRWRSAGSGCGGPCRTSRGGGGCCRRAGRRQGSRGWGRPGGQSCPRLLLPSLLGLYSHFTYPRGTEMPCEVTTIAPGRGPKQSILLQSGPACWTWNGCRGSSGGNSSVSVGLGGKGAQSHELRRDDALLCEPQNSPCWAENRVVGESCELARSRLRGRFALS